MRNADRTEQGAKPGAQDGVRPNAVTDPVAKTTTRMQIRSMNSVGAVAPERQTVLSPRLKLVYAVMGVLLACYLLSEILRDGQTWPWLDNWAVAGFEVVGSLLCMARATRGVESGRARVLPLALGGALLSWSLGDIVVAVDSGAARAPVLANVLYIAFYPLSYVALMTLLRRQVRRFTVETWLDGAIAGLGAAAVCSAFLFHSVLKAAGGPSDIVATNLAFPIGDLLLLAVVVAGTTMLPGRRRLPWVLLAAGFAINALGDTANLFASGLGATDVGMIANAVAWPISIFLISLSLWVRARPSAPLPQHAAPSFLAPAMATVASLAVLLVGSIGHVSRSTVWIAAAALAVAAVRSALSVTSLRNLTAERHRQAVTDQLTSLPNRRALFELIDALAEERRDGDVKQRQIVVLFVDLNRFKEINDSFGHSVGDELLRQLGERMRGVLRGSDLLARLGGDEFVVALLDADADYGATVAQRITSQLDEPFQLGAVRGQISASVGIAVSPRDATDTTDLLRCADLAMYRAKVEGKPFAMYNQELDGAGDRVQLVEDLRTAIGNRALELHYQPQINLESGETVAVEALVRWNHPQFGWIPPLEFLPLAEDGELMDPLTELVLDMALTQCARWRRQGHALTVCVNLSPSNLLDPTLPAMIVSALHRHGLTAEALVLEITETTAISDFERSKEMIEALMSLGLVVSVDDFGAGFTSLAYLSSLAVGELKLDRSFIHTLADSEDSRNLALVRSTIDLAHALGLRVVAEGVEDEPSLQTLIALNCDLAQGYLISKPRPAQELELAPYRSGVAVR